MRSALLRVSVRAVWLLLSSAALFVARLCACANTGERLNETACVCVCAVCDAGRLLLAATHAFYCEL